MTIAQARVTATKWTSERGEVEWDRQKWTDKGMEVGGDGVRTERRVRKRNDGDARAARVHKGQSVIPENIASSTEERRDDVMNER